MNRYVVAQPGTGRTALVYANTEAQALSLFRQYFRLQRDAAQLTCDRIARNVGGDEDTPEQRSELLEAAERFNERLAEIRAAEAAAAEPTITVIFDDPASINNDWQDGEVEVTMTVSAYEKMCADREAAEAEAHAAMEAYRARLAAIDCQISSIKVWKSPDKKETRIYVNMRGGKRSGCLYITGNRWQAAGTVGGNLTDEEWRQARLLALYSNHEGETPVWHTIYESEMQSELHRLLD